MKARLLKVSLWLLLLLNLMQPYLAQDATATLPPPITSEPSPEVSPVLWTETPTSTATETATATLEPTAEITEIVLPTAEITAEVTSEQTAEVIPTAINTATEPAPLLPEPVLAPVLSEAFHTGDLAQWNVGAGWGLVAQEQGFALQVTNSDGPVVSNVAHYDDVAVEMLVQTQTGTLNLFMRQTEIDGYRLSVNPNGQVDLYHGELLLATTNVTPAIADQWRHVRFSVMGDTLRVAIDTVEVIALRDTTPVLTAGAIYFNTTFPAQPGNSGQQFNTLLVDNIRFWIPENSITPLEPTVEVTEEVVVSEILPDTQEDDSMVVMGNPTSNPATAETAAELITAILNANTNCATTPQVTIDLTGTEMVYTYNT